MEDADFSFTTIEDSARAAFNLEHDMMDHALYTLGYFEEDGIFDGVSDCDWREAPSSSGVNNESRYSRTGGRVILVKMGECTKRIGIDGQPHAIKDAIKSAFGLRTGRPFWLEDEDGVIRAFDRDMPLRTYTLHLDEGVITKVCLSINPKHVACGVVEKIFYSQDDFSAFLLSLGWIGLRGLRGCWNVDSLDDLKSDELYHGIVRK